MARQGSRGRKTCTPLQTVHPPSPSSPHPFAKTSPSWKKKPADKAFGQYSSADAQTPHPSSLRHTPGCTVANRARGFVTKGEVLEQNHCRQFRFHRKRRATIAAPFTLPSSSNLSTPPPTRRLAELFRPPAPMPIIRRPKGPARPPHRWDFGTRQGRRPILRPVRRVGSPASGVHFIQHQKAQPYPIHPLNRGVRGGVGFILVYPEVPRGAVKGHAADNQKFLTAANAKKTGRAKGVLRALTICELWCLIFLGFS